jgi:predicted phage terminase large subunit-like protein
MERLRGGPETVESALLNTARRDGSGVRVRIPQDPGQAGKSQVASFTRLLAGFTVSSKPVSGDKITRAEPFAAQVNVGNVMMLRAEWNDVLISELRVFPNGAHDDQVDALSDAFDELNVNNFGLLDFMQSEAAAREAAQKAA